jgi:hypothetical protein
VKILSQKPKEVDGGERVEMLDARQAPYMNARMHARARRSVKKFSFTGMSDLFDRVIVCASHFRDTLTQERQHACNGRIY